MDDNTVLSKMYAYLQKVMKDSWVALSYELFEKGIYRHGNQAGIARMMRKALRGEEVTLCAFGGSVTRGACSTLEPIEGSGINHSLRQMNYVDHICEFLEAVFDCKINKVNAGIGATDTVYGIHRMEEDVLKHQPDLVIVEWCCNDGIEFPYKQATYECMVRRLLESKTAVMMLFLCYPSGNSSQILHEPISDWYDIPALSYRNAYFNIKEFPYLTSDNAHPNLVGYALIGLMVNYFFAQTMEELWQIGDEPIVCRPEALCEESMNYQGAGIVALKDIYDGKIDGARIKDMGSFSIDEEPMTFAFRQYYGFTAPYAKQYAPMVIELEACKTLFLQVYRNTVFQGTDFWVELNGEKMTSDTFTCQHGKDNNQVEWKYHWATERLCCHLVPQKVELKIYPAVTNQAAAVRLFALLVS